MILYEQSTNFFRAIIELHLQHIYTMIKIPLQSSFESVFDHQDKRAILMEVVHSHVFPDHILYLFHFIYIITFLGCYLTHI